MFGNQLWNQKILYLKGSHVILEKEMDFLS